MSLSTNDISNYPAVVGMAWLPEGVICIFIVSNDHFSWLLCWFCSSGVHRNDRWTSFSLTGHRKPSDLSSRRRLYFSRLILVLPLLFSFPVPPWLTDRHHFSYLVLIVCSRLAYYPLLLFRLLSLLFEKCFVFFKVSSHSCTRQCVLAVTFHRTLWWCIFVLYLMTEMIWHVPTIMTAV